MIRRAFALVAASAAVALPAAAMADVLAIEDFSSYDVPLSLDGAGSAGNGFSQAWDVHNEENEYTITNADPLGFGNYVEGSAVSTWHNAKRGLLTSPGGGTTPFESYISSEEPYNNDNNADQGVLYLGFVVRGEAGDQDGSLIGVDDSRFSNTAGRLSRAYIGLDSATSATNYVLIAAGSDGTVSYADTGIEIDGSVESVVLRLDMDNDTVTAWLNAGNEGASPAATIDVTGELRFKSARAYRGMDFDEFIIADTFADAVTAIPEPTTAGLLAMGAGLMTLRRRR